MTSTLDTRCPTAHVAEVWLNRPEVRNAFNDGVITELTEAFRSLSVDRQLRGILLGGRGKAFCAGADLSWMRPMAGYDWVQNQAAARLAEMLMTAWSCPVPVVGRIHGDCYAGGLGLAAVCDVLVAAHGVQFCLSEARLGLLPATIAPCVVPALGEQTPRRYFVTAERFDAATALALGFVHEVVPAEALDERVAAIDGALLAGGPAAVRACKRLLNDGAGRPLDAELRDETVHRIDGIRASDEGREGVAAFLAKRDPSWR